MTVTVTSSSNQTFNIAPNAGYVLSELKIDGNAVTTASSYTFENVTSNHTITANFSPISYTISYNLDGGTVTGNPTTYTIEDAITLVNPTKDGYNFTGWTGTGLTETTTTVTIAKGSTGNKTYTANWEVAGREFIKTTTLVDGATYIVCSDTNALQNNSGSIASSTVSVVNDKITTADKTIMWTYSGGKLINDATGTIYYLKGTSSAVSLATVASQTDIRYNASSSKLKVAEGQSSGYPWGGYYGTTSYYLVYNSGFTVNTSGSTITLYAEEGLKLNTPTGTGTSLTEISVSITGNVIPNGDIKYELYVNNSKKSETTQTSGRAITLKATGLSKNTTYSCYIKATSVSDSTIIVKSSTISVKTYSCDGTGSTCTSRDANVIGYVSYCETCQGSGGTLSRRSLSSEHSTSCSGKLSRTYCDLCDWKVEWCSMCGITSFTEPHSSSCSNFCKVCDGNMNYGGFYCKHAQTSPHPCCIHGYSSPHQ